MVWMSRAYLLLLLVSAVSGQKPPDASPKAPPKVEAALRARVNRFYQLEVDGKFRQAEPLVAEQSKDFFYSANKPRYAGFSIKGIEFSDNFKRATVVVLVKRMVPSRASRGRPFLERVPSHWKLEKGMWYWFADPSDTGSLPFPSTMPRRRACRCRPRLEEAPRPPSRPMPNMYALGD